MKNDLVKKAIECLTIQDVYLRECVIKQKDEFDPKIPKYAEIEAQFLHRPLETSRLSVSIDGQDKPIDLLKAKFEGIFRILPPRNSPEMENVDIQNLELPNEQVLVEVRAVFIAEYLIIKDDLSEDAISEFSQFNVGYHVWPYWRELTQSISNRLRLPPIIPPLYRVPPDAQ